MKTLNYVTNIQFSIFFQSCYRNDIDSPQCHQALSFNSIHQVPPTCTPSNNNPCKSTLIGISISLAHFTGLIVMTDTESYHVNTRVATAHM